MTFWQPRAETSSAKRKPNAASSWKSGSIEVPQKFGGVLFFLSDMARRQNREHWRRDIESRQRNTNFPDTVENEARFWRNLDNQPYRTSTKVGLAILAIFVFGFLGAILVGTHQAGVTWRFLLGMLLFCGSIFSVIAWAARRNLSIANHRRRRKMRNP